jgi:sigma-B regulation protein RsbU (phosphoserine phosphatase)
MLSNAMLLANGLANTIGIMAVNHLDWDIDLLSSLRTTPRVESELLDLTRQIDTVFTPAVFLVVMMLIIWFEWPIRRFLKARAGQVELSPAEQLKARQRLLNEPYLVIALDFGVWVLAALTYSSAFLLYDAPLVVVVTPILSSISTGFITVAVLFFELELILRKWLAPLFFPRGGLASVPGTWRVKIKNRLLALFMAVNLVPFLIVLIVVQVTYLGQADPSHLLSNLRQALQTLSVLFIGAGAFLTALVSLNLARPFKDIIQVLQEVRNGVFNRKVRVATSDELGYTGDVINEMTQGLLERDRMRQSLALAMEVQQRLLPKNPPQVPGLDIAGRSIYCDETGGDYFDYLEHGPGCLGLAVGDVSDHGIQSALLMTTARAFLRQRASRRGSLAGIMADVNRQLARDVEESGQFMTMFYCEVDVSKRSLSWVRAGHDPALLFERNSRSFQELGGRGLALGLMEQAEFEELSRPLQGGEVLVMATDGIWEAQNRRGEPFGKEALKRVIRDNSQGSAQALVDAVIEAVARFSGHPARKDDLTLVVVKVDI